MSGTVERKLRPLYDALDNLNNKQVIQRADKLLKKEKDLHCAKVLKALALVRLMKNGEAMALLNEVKECFPLDEATLQAMCYCYKELLCPEEIPYLYETALKYNPNSEDHLTQLFMSYVRVQEYKKQQQVATRLVKLTSKSAYSYWNAASLFLMGKENPELGKMMCFPLALKVIEKTKEKSPEVAEEVFRLYLDVLEVLGENRQALHELENCERNKLIDDRERWRLKLHYGTILGDTEMCNILYKEAIVNEPDSYSYFKGYFDTAFPLLTDTSYTHNEDFEITPNQCDRSVSEMTGLLLKVSDGIMRGPELAKIDLVTRLRELGVEVCPFASPNLLILDFVQKFGHKMCCYDDLTVVLGRLTAEEDKEELITLIEEYRATVKDNNGTKAMARLATLHMLLHHLESHNMPLVEGKEDMSLVEIENFANITLEGDLGCGYIETFAALYTWRQCGANATKSDIVSAIKVLTAKLEQAPESATCRLLATRLYDHLGGIGPAVETYGGLDTKSVQLDSLAHLLYPSFLPLGAFNRADKHARQMESFYRTNEREVLEYIVKSYLAGKFNKVPELFNLQESLSRSISKAVFALDKIWLSFILTTATSWQNIEALVTTAKEDLSMIECDNLIDNRDYNCNEQCSTRAAELAEIQKNMSFAHDSLYVRMRRFMIEGIAALVSGEDVAPLLSGYLTEVVERAVEIPCRRDLPVYLMMSNSMAPWVEYVPYLGTVVEQAHALSRVTVAGEQGDHTGKELLSQFDMILETTREKVIAEDGTLENTNLPYLSCLVQCLCFTLVCYSPAVSACRVARKKKALAESSLVDLKKMISDTQTLCEECKSLAVVFKLTNLTIVKDETVDSKIASSVEWTIENFTGVLDKMAHLAKTLSAVQKQGKQT